MGIDILILTIYAICVVYVLYQMALSVEDKLEDQYEVVLDSEALQAAVAAQLQNQNIYQATAEVIADKSGSLLQLTFLNQDQPVGKVILQIAPQGKRPLQPPINDLNVSLINGLPNQQVFINWDNSSLSVHGGLAQRVIRLVPGMPIDLYQPQVMTIANPGQGVNARVTSESLFNRPEDKTALASAPSLVDFSNIAGMKEPMRVYSLQLLVWVRSMLTPNAPAMQLLMPFNFRINVLPDHVALPILSWLLDFFAQKPKQST